MLRSSQELVHCSMRARVKEKKLGKTWPISQEVSIRLGKRQPLCGEFKFESESTNIRVARLSFNMKIAGSGICCHSCHVCCFHRQYLSLGPFICFVSVITAVMYICQTVGVLWPRCFGLKVHKNTPCSIYFRIIYARTELGSENANKCVSRPLRINRTGRLCRFAREVSKQLFDKMCLGYVVTNFMRVVSIKFAIALKHRQN